MTVSDGGSARVTASRMGAAKRFAMSSSHLRALRRALKDARFSTLSGATSRAIRSPTGSPRWSATRGAPCRSRDGGKPPERLRKLLSRLSGSLARRLSALRAAVASAARARRRGRRTGTMRAMSAGAEDIVRAASALTSRLPWPLGVLARLAYNYRWAWLPDGPDVFRAVDPDRWRACERNPVRLLQETSAEALLRAAADGALVARAEQLERALLEDLARPAATDVVGEEHPVAFFCAEHGVHVSLPIYAGGLGALAGDILKEASDRALPFVGVGLMYRFGYFHQRVDHTGWQQETWYPTDPERSPAVLVTVGDERAPLRVSVPIGQDHVTAQVWRVLAVRRDHGADNAQGLARLLIGEIALAARIGPIHRRHFQSGGEGNGLDRAVQVALFDLAVGGIEKFRGRREAGPERKDMFVAGDGLAVDLQPAFDAVHPCATTCPPGPQLAASMRAVVWARRRSSPPAASTTKTPWPNSRVEAKDIWRSSGDQLGMMSSAGCEVSWRISPLRKSSTKMLVSLPIALPRSEEKAILVPSWLNTGSRSSKLPLVNWRWLLPSGETAQRS